MGVLREGTGPLVGVTWYHGGQRPEGDRLIHLGTREAAIQRIDPARWDPACEFPMIGCAQLWEVRLHPQARVHPEVGIDYADPGDDWAMSVGSLDYRLPDGYDAKPYRNDNEDPGSVSLLVHGSQIASVRPAEDVHAVARGVYRQKVLADLRDDDPAEYADWYRIYQEVA